MSVCCAGQETSQKEEGASVPTVYKAVLDKLFGEGSADCGANTFQSLMVLRFVPSFGKESQIEVLTCQQSEPRITIRLLDASQEPIYETVFKNSQSGTYDVSKATAVTKTRVTVLHPVPASTTRVLTQFSTLRISPMLDKNVVIDSVRYQLTIRTASNTVHYSLAGSKIDQDTHDHPLVQWMNLMRKTLEKTGVVKRTDWN